MACMNLMLAPQLCQQPLGKVLHDTWCVFCGEVRGVSAVPKRRPTHPAVPTRGHAPEAGCGVNKGSTHSLDQSASHLASHEMVYFSSHALLVVQWTATRAGRGSSCHEFWPSRQMM